MRNENTCTHIFSFLMGNLSLLTDWRGKLSSQQQEACQTGKASGREQIPLWSITITLVGAEGNHTASSRNVAWVLGPPAAATGLRKGLHDTSVTEVGMTPPSLCGLLSTREQVHGQRKRAYVQPPTEVRGFKKLNVTTTDTNLQFKVTQPSISLVLLISARWIFTDLALARPCQKI